MSIFNRNKNTAPVAPKTDTELGLPYGEPGSRERALWILADADRQDREDRELEESLRRLNG
jgi:hypothetical protein